MEAPNSGSSKSTRSYTRRAITLDEPYFAIEHSHQTMKKARLPEFRDRITLGPNRVLVSPFCLGTTTEETVVEAHARGVNFFFITADMHWPLYEGTRRGIAALLRKGVPRDELVVAAVSYVAQPEFCFAPFQEVIEAIPGLGHIDVAVMGGCYQDNMLTRQGIYDEHRRAKFCGIRAIGASFHGRDVASQMANTSLIDIGYVRYNPEHAGAELDLFPALAADHRPLYNFKSTMGYMAEEAMHALGVPKEKWRPEATDYYRFALTNEAITGILFAAQSTSEIRKLEDALKRGPLDEEERAYLKDLAALASGRAALVT
jgi:hypothetical protein